MINSITCVLIVLARNETEASRILQLVGVVGGGAAIALIIRYFMNKAANQRMLALRAVAKQFGWTFFAQAPLSYVSRSENFPLFNEGQYGKIFNLMSGEANGIKVSVFDYQYRTGFGRTATRHDQSVVYLEPANLHLPYFSLHPNTFLGKFSETLGYEAVELDEHPEFSEHFILRGKDEQEIRKLFNSQLVSFYADYDYVSTEAAGNQVFLYRPGREDPPPDTQQNVGLGLELIKLLQQ